MQLEKIRKAYPPKGVAPHIYLPWTPEHLKEDKDLSYVLERIQSLK